MAILIDSNVLLDLLHPNSDWFGWSSRALMDLANDSGLLINVVIAAEVAYGFSSEAAFDHFISNMPIGNDRLPDGAAWRAAEAHKRFRFSGGKRERVLPDFLIGAHAAVRGHSILTRDPAGYRAYFPTVEIIAPDTHP